MSTRGRRRVVRGRNTSAIVENTGDSLLHRLADEALSNPIKNVREKVITTHAARGSRYQKIAQRLAPAEDIIPPATPISSTPIIPTNPITFVNENPIPAKPSFIQQIDSVAAAPNAEIRQLPAFHMPFKEPPPPINRDGDGISDPGDDVLAGEQAPGQPTDNSTDNPSAEQGKSDTSGSSSDSEYDPDGSEPGPDFAIHTEDERSESSRKSDGLLDGTGKGDGKSTVGKGKAKTLKRKKDDFVVDDEEEEEVEQNTKKKKVEESQPEVTVDDLLKVGALKIIFYAESSNKMLDGMTLQCAKDPLWNDAFDRLEKKWKAQKLSLMNPEYQLLMATGLIALGCYTQNRRSVVKEKDPIVENKSS